MALQARARNQFNGNVTSRKLGDEQTMSAVITSESAEHLGLAGGTEVFAKVKATEVIVATKGERA